MPARGYEMRKFSEYIKRTLEQKMSRRKITHLNSSPTPCLHGGISKYIKGEGKENWIWDIFLNFMDLDIFYKRRDRMTPAIWQNGLYSRGNTYFIFVLSYHFFKETECTHIAQ